MRYHIVHELQKIMNERSIADTVTASRSPLPIQTSRSITSVTRQPRSSSYLCARVQQRWVFAVMGSLALVNVFAMRTCLSVTIVEMVKPTANTTQFDDSDDACPATPSFSVPSSSSRGGSYEWDEYTQGIILSSFYWGYIFTQIPGGLLVGKFGAKYLLGGGVLLSAIWTLSIPTVVAVYGSTGLIVTRFLMGINEGAVFAALAALIAQWAPPNERTKISTMVMSGIPVGTVVANSLSGILISYSPIGWPLVFYFFGGCAVLWFSVWVVLCYDHPEDHPFISEKEKKYLKETVSEHTQRQSKPIPWRQMMTSGPVWALLIGKFGFTCSFYTMLSDLPKYVSSVLKFPIQTNGLLSALPYLLDWVVSNSGSWLADWLIKNEKMSRTNVRKVMNVAASVLSAIFVLTATHIGCDRTLVMTLFIIGIGVMGLYYPSLMVNPNDLSPNYSDTLMSLACSMTAIIGTLIPYVIGVLTPNQTPSEWRTVFWIISGLGCGSSVLFVILGDGEVQPWNNPEAEDQGKVEIVNRTFNERYKELDID